MVERGLQDRAGAVAMFTLFLLENGIEHAVPLGLEARIQVRSFARTRFDDLKFQRPLSQRLGILCPGEETGSDSGIERRQAKNIHLCTFIQRVKLRQGVNRDHNEGLNMETLIKGVKLRQGVNRDIHNEGLNMETLIQGVKLRQGVNRDLHNEGLNLETLIQGVK